MTNLLEVRENIVHADSADGMDYTLCGVTAENIINSMREYDAADESECEPAMLKTNKKINCPKCAAIIRYCHGIRLSSIDKQEARSDKA